MRLTLTLIICLIYGCSVPPDKTDPANMPTPPVADIRPFAITSPHGSRTDNYYWLRDDERKNADMLAYLEA